MKTPTEKYLDDEAYKYLVDTMERLIASGHLTPFELSEAVVFAATKAEMFRAQSQGEETQLRATQGEGFIAKFGEAGREPSPPPIPGADAIMGIDPAYDPPSPPAGPLSAISSPTGEHPGPTADCKRGFHQGHPDCIHCGAPRVT